MLLNRLGNKSKLLPTILPLFPRNITSFIDMFAGSLSVSVAMLNKAKYIISNDYDHEISNLYHVWRESPDALCDALALTPYHSDILQRWKKSDEADPVWKAARFVYMANFTLMSKTETMKFGQSNSRQITLQAIRQGFKHIARIQFMSCDFRECLSRICWRHERDKGQAFCYADPPYLSCEHDSYRMAERWTAQDTADLFDMLTASGMRFAVSEFDNPAILELAARYGLHIHDIGERRNLNNRRREILVTNYEVQPAQASLFLPSICADVDSGGRQSVGACR